MRASIGGPPDSRNSVRMRTVAVLSNTPRVASSNRAGALGGGAPAAGAAAGRRGRAGGAIEGPDRVRDAHLTRNFRYFYNPDDLTRR